MIRAGGPAKSPDLPGFNPASLIGSSVDGCHRQPAHQARLLDTLAPSHRAEIEVGGRTVRNNAENAGQVNQVARAARASAQRGGEVVGEAVSAMAQMDKASSRIAEIIGLIDDIAFRTNLPPLNAPVESARAGERRGFAVVASEVRNLAPRPADAARGRATEITGALPAIDSLKRRCACI